MKMEWTEDHDIQLVKEVLVSEPYRFKPRAVQARLPAVRTVKRAKIWQYVDRKQAQWSDEHSLSRTFEQQSAQLDFIVQENEFLM